VPEPVLRVEDGARLAALTHEDFVPRVGECFQLVLEDRALELTLLRADRLGGREPRPGQRRPFSLVFLGPGEPVLGQRIYRLEHTDLSDLDLFLVPIGRDERGVRYESVFA
jgi:hypothetical protein